jgi:hypothetical protein
VGRIHVGVVLVMPVNATVRWSDDGIVVYAHV